MRKVAMLLAVLLCLTLCTLLERDPVTICLRDGRAGLPLEVYTSFAEGRRLTIIQPHNGTRVKLLVLDQRGLKIQTNVAGELTVHQYDVDGELQIRTIDQSDFDRLPNSSWSTIIPREQNTNVVLISTVGVNCPGNWSTELKPLQYHQSNKHTMIVAGDDSCQHTFQILMASDRLFKELKLSSGLLESPLRIMQRIKQHQTSNNPFSSSVSLPASNKRLLMSCPPQTYDSGVSTCLPCSGLGKNCGNCTSTACTSCSTVYYMNGTSCLPCNTISNCLSCSNSTFCTVCYNYYYSDNNGVCQSCGVNCYNCSSSTVCISCNPSSYLVAGVCYLCSGAISGCSYCTNSSVCQQCDSNHNLESGLCYDCRIYNVYCLTCQDKSTCNTCTSGYYKSGQNACSPCNTYNDNCTSCADANPSVCLGCNTTYFLNSSSQCQLCSITNCQICTSQTKCTSCRGGYYVVTVDSLTANCVKCPTNCSTCNISTCIACTSNFILKGTGCVACADKVVGCNTCNTGYCLSCLTNYYYVSATKICSICNVSLANCITCSSSTVCTSCSPTYYVSGNVCALCTIANCVTCTATSCTACATTFYLASSTSCPTCQVNNCLTCTSPTMCTGCVSNLYALTSMSGNIQCSLCNYSLTGCVSCSSSSVCIACQASLYYLDTGLGTCVNCPTGCNTCTNSNVCLTCHTPTYYMNPVTNLCDPCTLLSNCVQCTDATHCTACVSTMYYVDPTSQCVTCSSLTPHCNTCDPATGVCTTCPNTHYLDVANICQPCAASLTGCLTCNTNAICLSCVDNTFYYDGTSACSLCSLASPHCLTCSNAATCLTCTSMYWPVAGVCTLCQNLMPNCYNCSGSGPAQCLYCNDTHHYISAGVCVLCSSNAALSAGACDQCTWDGSACTLCFTTHFLNNTDGFCYLCSVALTSDCLTCTSNTVCTSCTPLTHFLYTDGTCQLCSLTLGTYCTACSSSAVCTACSAGSYLSAGNCLQCSLDATLTSNCLQCSTASGTLQCTLCTPDYFVGATSGLCEACSTVLPFCQTCNGITTTCTACNDTTHYIWLGACVICPAGCLTCVTGGATCLTCHTPTYYMNPVTNLCDPCTLLSNCVQCTDATHCTACVSTMYYVDPTSQCVTCSSLTPHCNTCDPATGVCTTCPNTHYLDVANICQPCAASLTGCLTCNTNAICLSCVDNTFYYDGTSACSLCSLASPHCLTCSNAATCLTCTSMYWPVAGVCTLCQNLMPNCYNCSGSGPAQCLYCNDTHHYISAGVCVLCSSNAALSAGACDQCTWDGSACTLCFTTHFLNNTDGFCYLCSVALTSDCLTCTSNTVCTSCTPLTHFLYTDGTCQLCSLTLGTYCTACSSSAVCTACSAGSYLSAGNCLQCSLDATLTSNCLQCSTASGTLQCTLCTPDYFVGATSGLCEACSTVLPFCQTCNGITTTCTACNDTTHYIWLGACVICPAGCLTCVTGGATCLTCHTPTYYMNPVTNLCDPCTLLSNCVQCTDATHCTACVSTMYYVDPTSQCVTCSSLTPHCNTCDPATGVCTTCPNTHYLDVANICQPCAASLTGCLTCNTNAICLSCVDNTFYYDGTSACSLCSLASPHCLTCSNAATCLTCTSMYWPVAGVCTLCQNLMPNCYNCSGSGPAQCLYCNDTHHYISAGVCVLCSSNAALSAGACDQCTWDGSACTLCFTTHFLNNTDGFCYLCSVALTSDCLTCTSNTVCTSCTPLTHFLYTDGTCQLCSLTLGTYCTACSSSAVCTACSAGSYLSAGNCLQCSLDATLTSNCLQCSTASGTLQCTLCTPDYFVGATSGLCEACSTVLPFCQTCNGITTTCTACNDTTHYIWLGACVICPAGCLTCVTGGATCLTCHTPTYYMNPVTNLCDPCTLLSNCVQCTDATHCTACVSTMYYVDPTSQCVTCSSLTPHCNTCDPATGVCTTCPNTHYLDVANICQPCAASLTGCLTCNTNAICLSCVDNTFYYDGTSACSLCSLASPHCLTCSNAATCLTCTSMYWPVAGVCTLCQNLMPNCYNCSGSGPAQCLYCNDTHHYISAGVCVLCSSNAALSAGACDQCTWDGSACTLCFTTHFLNNTDGFCYLCSVALTSDCLTCTSNTVCTSCTPLTHFLYTDGTCQLCSLTLGTYCTACSSSAVCTACSAGSYLSAGNCLQCSLDATLTSNCLQCSTASGTLQCTLCTPDYFVGATSGLCEACSTVLPFCQTCNGITTTCTACNDTTHYIWLGACVICPAGCLTCVTGGATCLTCHTPTYYMNPVTNLCDPCTLLSNCVQCTDATHCTACVSTMYYVDPTSQCVTCSSLTPHCNTCDPATGVCTTCPNTHYLDVANICQPCAASLTGCLTCNTNAICLSCVDNTFYYDGTSACSLCSLASPHCLTCSNAATCLTCTSMYWPVAGVCTLCQNLMPNCYNCSGSGPAQCLYCNDTHHYISAGVCVLCSSNAALSAGACDQCTWDGSACTLCFTTHFLNNTDGFCYLCSVALTSDCLTCTSNTVCTSCTPLTHFLYTDGTCQLCSLTLGTYCTACSSSAVCTACSAGSYLSAGNCLQCSLDLVLTDKCTQCTFTTSPQCLNCSPGYFLTSGRCHSCTSQMDGCQYCPSNETCTSCYNPYFIYDSQTRSCKTRRWLKIASLKKVKYQNTVEIGISYSTDVDPTEVQVSIPHSTLEFLDLKQTIHSPAVGSAVGPPVGPPVGPAVGPPTFEYYEIEGTCKLRVHYTENLEGNYYQLWVSDPSGKLKVSLTFYMTSDNDELVNYYNESYYTACRGIYIFYILELTLASIAFAVSIPMQMKLAFLEPLSILAFLPLFASVFKKVDSALFAIKETNISEATFGLCLISISLMPYICYFVSKLLAHTKKFKFNKGSLQYFQHLIIRQWTFIMGVLVIGFVPYLFRLCIDYPDLRPALIIIPGIYLCCLALTLYHFQKAYQQFGELSMENSKNTIWLALGYLITNLFIGIISAASRNTYAWYTFLIAPLVPIAMMILVAVRRPYGILFENIRCSLNFAILAISILVLNLTKVASESFVVLFYLMAAGVSLTLSIGNLVYSKVGLAYKLRPRIEYGDRKESEIELGGASRLQLNSEINLVHSKKAKKFEKYNLNTSSDGLSDASRKPFANNESDIDSSSSRANHRSPKANIFDSRSKLKRKEQDLIENNRHDKDTLKLFSSVKRKQEENKANDQYEEITSEQNKTEVAKVEFTHPILLSSAHARQIRKYKQMEEQEEQELSIESTIHKKNSDLHSEDRITTKQNIREEQIRPQEFRELQPSEVQFIRSSDGFNKKEKPKNNLNNNTEKKQVKPKGRTFDRTARLISGLQKAQSQQPSSYVSEAMKAQMSKGINSHIKTREGETSIEKTKKKKKKISTHEEERTEPGQNEEQSMRVEDIEDEYQQEEIPESQREVIKGIIFSKVRKQRPKKLKSESTTDGVKTQENEPSFKEEESHLQAHHQNQQGDIVIEAIEDEQDERGEPGQTYYKDLNKLNNPRPLKSKSQTKKRSYKKGEMVLANYLQEAAKITKIQTNEHSERLQKTYIKQTNEKPNNQNPPDYPNVQTSAVENIEDDDTHNALITFSKAKKLKNSRPHNSNGRDIYRNRFHEEQVNLNEVAGMLKTNDMTEQQVRSENQKLKQKYVQRGQRLNVQKTKVVEINEYSEEIEDPTGTKAILSSIAQFLPEKNRSRMERIVREQELTNKRRFKKKKLLVPEDDTLREGQKEMKETYEDCEVQEQREDSQLEHSEPINQSNQPSVSIADERQSFLEKQKLRYNRKSKSPKKERANGQQNRQQILSSIAQFLPENNRNRMQRLIGQQNKTLAIRAKEEKHEEEKQDEEYVQVEQTIEHESQENLIEIVGTPQEENKSQHERKQKYNRKKPRRISKLPAKEKEIDQKEILQSISQFLPDRNRRNMERVIYEQKATEHIRQQNEALKPYEPEVKYIEVEQEQEQKRPETIAIYEQDKQTQHERLKEKYRYKGPKKVKELPSKQIDREEILSSIAQFLPDKNRKNMQRVVHEQELTRQIREKDELLKQQQHKDLDLQEVDNKTSEERLQEPSALEKQAEHERLKQKYRYKGPVRRKKEEKDEIVSPELDRLGTISSIAQFLPDRNRRNMQRIVHEQAYTQQIRQQDELHKQAQQQSRYIKQDSQKEVEESCMDISEDQRPGEQTESGQKYRYRGPANKSQYEDIRRKLDEKNRQASVRNDVLPNPNNNPMENVLRQHYLIPQQPSVKITPSPTSKHPEQSSSTSKPHDVEVDLQQDQEERNAQERAAALQRVVERNRQKQKIREKAKQEAIDRHCAKPITSEQPTSVMPESVRKTMERAKKHQPKANNIYFEGEKEDISTQQHQQPQQQPFSNHFHIEDLE